MGDAAPDVVAVAPLAEEHIEASGRRGVLDRAGLARVLSLPPGADEHRSGILSSYRVKQGVLHNPKSDRRTTQGIFHVADGGLPIPADKCAVPKATFAAMNRRAPARYRSPMQSRIL